MFRIFYAEKDTTLYEQYENTNTGIDEVLEVGKRLQADGTVKKSAPIKVESKRTRTAIAAPKKSSKSVAKKKPAKRK